MRPLQVHHTITPFINIRRGYRPRALFPSLLALLVAAPLIIHADIASESCAMSAVSSLPSKILDLKQTDIDKLHSLATAWAGLNGLLVMRSTGIQVAPISLLPTPFPRRVYKQVNEVMVSMHLAGCPKSMFSNHSCRSSTSTISCIG